MVHVCILFGNRMRFQSRSAYGPEVIVSDAISRECCTKYEAKANLKPSRVQCTLRDPNHPLRQRKRSHDQDDEKS